MNQLKSKSIHRWVWDNRGSIGIRFGYQNKRYSFNPINGARFEDERDRLAASAIAAKIELDIKSGLFTGLDAYKPKNNLVELVDPKSTPKAQQKSLLEFWEDYKETQSTKTEKTSQKTKWLAADKLVNILLEIPFENLSPIKAVELLLKTYKSSSIRTALTYVCAALELAVKRDEIKVNPLAGFKTELPKHTNLRKKSGFSLDSVNAIVEAFRSDQYVADFSNYQHSYYAEFVEFLFLTGLRPQMPIALRWSDIRTKKDGSRVILLDRAYTNGCLKRGKNNRAVLFPVYPQLGELIDRIPRRSESLVFPSFTGGFINLNNFTRRYWSVVLKGLVADLEIPEYLPTYHCRHTAATKMAAAGVPLATIAALLDTSEEMLNRHYIDNGELTESLSLDSLY